MVRLSAIYRLEYELSPDGVKRDPPRFRRVAARDQTIPRGPGEFSIMRPDQILYVVAL
jgi:hypothetical protein